MKLIVFKVKKTERKEEVILENLIGYRQRTRGFMMDSLPFAGGFETNPELREKVDDQGHLRPFRGDTVVFQADDILKRRAEDLQKILYENCGDMLAEPLKPDNFHMTLHDLSSNGTGDAFEQKMEQNRQEAAKILNLVRMESSESIHVNTVGVFNMVSTSVVLGLEPADESACTRLMELYERLQMVVPLNYPLTLHITLGYYRPGCYTSEQRQRLGGTFVRLNREMGQKFCLREKNLRYERFEDMNHYISL